ncbi:MAG: family 16 glycosylhydrolase, partial [Flavobacteriales bacterium]
MPVGQGMWPAFWLLPNDKEYGRWPLSGEIDITEMVGYSPNTTHGTIHYGGSWPFNIFVGESTVSPGGNLNNQFHDYAVEWSETEIKWFFDGQLFSVKNTESLGTFPWPFDQDFYVILNLALGGNWPGYPDASTQFPQELVVDYVRLYQGPQTAFIKGNADLLQNGTIETYSIPNWEGANVQWTVLGGEIQSGQGSSSINVLWDEADNHELSANVSFGDCNFDIDKNIHVASGCERLITDFEDVRLAHWASFSGSFNEESVISPNEVNSSVNCGRYMRSSTDPSVLKMTLRGLVKPSELENGNFKIKMDVFTNAPIGSSLVFYLEDQIQTNFPGSSGRRSGYTTSTTTQYEWEELVFDFFGVVNETILEENINHLAMIPVVSENNNFSFYMDNLMLVESDCLTNDIAKVKDDNDFFTWHNKGETTIFSTSIQAPFSVIDLSGRIITTDQSTAHVNQELTLNPGIYFLQFTLKNQQIKSYK